MATHDEIAALAFKIYQAKGGTSEENWAEAEEALNAPEFVPSSEEQPEEEAMEEVVDSTVPTGPIKAQGPK